jgi:hypothetical protein
VKIMTLRVSGIISRARAQVVLVRAGSMRPLEPPEAYKAVPGRVRGLDGVNPSRHD